MRYWKQAKKTFLVFSKMWRYLQWSHVEGANCHDLKKRYIRELLAHLQLEIKTINPQFAQAKSPAIFVCNHISYLDIPLIMQTVPHACFVSKAEVARWRVIGSAAKRIGTVFVQRGCKKSRQVVRERIANAIVNEGKSVAVFPSGTTKIVKAESWRRGVFEIAQEHRIPVIPVRISYLPLRKAAYIDKDNFVLHLLNLMDGERVRVQMEFRPPQFIEHASREAAEIHLWCEEDLPTLPKTTVTTKPRLQKP